MNQVVGDFLVTASHESERGHSPSEDTQLLYSTHLHRDGEKTPKARDVAAGGYGDMERILKVICKVILAVGQNVPWLTTEDEQNGLPGKSTSKGLGLQVLTPR